MCIRLLLVPIAEFASRTCGDNGTWALVKLTPIGPSFTNYTMCTLSTQHHIRTIEAFQVNFCEFLFIAANRNILSEISYGGLLIIVFIFES